MERFADKWKQLESIILERAGLDPERQMPHVLSFVGPNSEPLYIII